MIKIVASHSLKVPADQEYSSKSFHVGLEVEVADSIDGNEILSRTKNLFQLARIAVNKELNGSVPVHNNGNNPGNNGNGRMTQNQNGTGGDNGRYENNNLNGNGGGTRNNNGGGRNGSVPASSKQLNYLLSLAKRNGGYRELQDTIQSRYGVGDLESLAKSEASKLIEEYKNNGGGNNGRG